MFIICIVAFIFFLLGFYYSPSPTQEREEQLKDREESLSRQISVFEERQRVFQVQAEEREKQLKICEENFANLKKETQNASRRHISFLSTVYQQKFDELDSIIGRYQNELENSRRVRLLYEKKLYDLEVLSTSKNQAYAYLSRLLADIQLIDYEDSIYCLENKSRPAKVEAKRIRELKSQTREYLTELNLLKYRFSELLSLFPDLDSYIEDSTSFVAGSHRTFTLPDEVWDSLSASERNQMILDNYIRGSKTKWQIGRDYELFVGYKYTMQGYFVDYYGSNHGIEDLGRDLIVSKDGKIGIIQCKYWSSKKLIHEKHIAQLYGTVVSYIIEHNCVPDSVHGIFVTNIKLSATAKKFADYLGIRYKEDYPIGDFPRIKCNIGRDEFGSETKIYHLPTDQQYDSVKIIQPGECFAFTVAEAESKGFRHAYKWHSS